MPDTPQSHQCGFIAQSEQQIDQLIYALVGGEIGEDGKNIKDHTNKRNIDILR